MFIAISVHSLRLHKEFHATTKISNTLNEIKLVEISYGMIVYKVNDAYLASNE